MSLKLIGLVRLTRDPEQTMLSSGASVTKLSGVHNEVYVNNAGVKIEKAHYIDLTAWGQVGDTIAHYVRKGQQIMIEAVPDHQSWEDKETGKTRSKLGFKVLGMTLLPKTAPVETRGEEETEEPVMRQPGPHRSTKPTEPEAEEPSHQEEAATVTRGKGGKRKKVEEPIPF